MMPLVLRRPVGEAWRALRTRVAERPRACPQTLREEVALCGLAYCNGLWSLLLPGGYVVGWRYAGLVLPQQGYGLVTLSLALYATYGLVHGDLRHRVRACLAGIAIAGVTGFFVALANPLALPIPMFAWIVWRRLSMIAEMGRQAGRATPHPA